MATGFERLVHKRRHFPPGNFIPGIGGPYYTGGNGMDDSVDRNAPFKPRRQQAPFKRGQTKRTQRLKRPTRPTPGSYPHRPRLD